MWCECPIHPWAEGSGVLLGKWIVKTDATQQTVDVSVLQSFCQAIASGGMLMSKDGWSGNNMYTHHGT